METQILESTKTEVENAVDNAFELARSLSQSNFRLFLALGDYFEIFEHTNESPYVIENVDDIRYDTNRIKFLTRYLHNHYERGGFSYQDADGIDCITIELMIYSQMWESDFFLKTLSRLASLAIGEEYLWNPFEKETLKGDEKKEESNWTWVHRRIIHPLKNKGVALGDLINECYCPNLRHSFAHSIYEISERYEEINYFGFNRPEQKRKRLFYPQKSYSLSFSDFQVKFLKSAHLSYYLNALLNRYRFYELNKLHSVEKIELPTRNTVGIKVIQEFGINRFVFE